MLHFVSSECAINSSIKMDQVTISLEDGEYTIEIQWKNKLLTFKELHIEHKLNQGIAKGK